MQVQKSKLSVKAVCAPILVAATLLGGTTPAAAEYTTADVNMRAGPSVRYPSLGTIPEGSFVEVTGCTRGYRWCDVRAGGRRGWMSGAYVGVEYEARRLPMPAYVRSVVRPSVPIVSFNLNSYWESNYSDYDFYRNHDDWDGVDWEHDDNPPGWDPQWQECDGGDC